MRISDLLSTKVTTESGRRLGRVHDVRGELTSPTLKVTGLFVGPIGLLERLGIGAPESRGQTHRHSVLPWSAVVRATRNGITVRDVAKPK